MCAGLVTGAERRSRLQQSSPPTRTPTRRATPPQRTTTPSRPSAPRRATPRPSTSRPTVRSTAPRGPVRVSPRTAPSASRPSFRTQMPRSSVRTPVARPPSRSYRSSTLAPRSVQRLPTSQPRTSRSITRSLPSSVRSNTLRTAPSPSIRARRYSIGSTSGRSIGARTPQADRMIRPGARQQARTGISRRPTVAFPTLRPSTGSTTALRSRIGVPLGSSSGRTIRGGLTPSLRQDRSITRRGNTSTRGGDRSDQVAANGREPRPDSGTSSRGSVSESTRRPEAVSSTRGQHLLDASRLRRSLATPPLTRP